MDKYLDKDIYRKAKKMADETYKRHSAYKSMFLVRKYKELGGKFKGDDKDEKPKLMKWRQERWIKVLPYLLENREVKCGAGGKDKHSCRPLIRVDKTTPTTLPELVKKHGKKKIKELAEMKKKDISIRINWELGKPYNKSNK